MTRIEATLPGVEVGDDEIQGAIKEEAKKLRPETKVIRKRPFFSCCNCLFVGLIILVALAGWVLVSLAKTGLINIPVVSGLVYSVPQPLHLVAVKPGEKFDLASGASQSMVVSNDGSGAAQISEKELTALLQDNIGQINKTQSKFALQWGQVAIEPDKAQLFVSFLKPNSLYLTVDFQPQLENQKIVFVPRDIKIGNFSLPLFAGQYIFNNFVNNQLEAALKNLPVIFKSVNLSQGKIMIIFNIDKNKIQNNVK